MSLLNRASLRLRALPVIDTCLRAYVPLPSSINVLRAFLLSCYKYRCLSAPMQKKFNIVRNDHGHTQRCEFSVLDRKQPFRANLEQKIKIFSQSWSLERRPIQWWSSLFLFWTRNTLFVQIWTKNTKLSAWVKIWYLY